MIVGPDIRVVRVSDLELIRRHLSGLEGLQSVRGGLNVSPELRAAGQRVFGWSDEDATKATLTGDDDGSGE